MKRFYFIAILAAICGMTAMAQDRPDLTHQTGGDDRIDFAFIMDMPSLVYDGDAQEIIVMGSQSDYYTVTIMSQSTQMIMLETMVDGEYDIIDVSMLATGTYIIALTSPRWNTYSWSFTQGVGLSNIKTTGKATGVLNNASGDRFKFRE